MDDPKAAEPSPGTPPDPVSADGNEDLDAILFGNYEDANDVPMSNMDSPSAVLGPSASTVAAPRILEQHNQDIVLPDATETEQNQEENMEGQGKGEEQEAVSASDAISLSVSQQEADAPSPFVPVDFEIALPSIDAGARAEYFEPHSDIVDFVVAEVRAGSFDEPIYCVEFTDGTQETVGGSQTPFCLFDAFLYAK